MITFKIAVRNIFRHKTRSIITLSTIIFGCAALIFAGGFFEDVFFKMRETYIKAHTGHIQIYKKGFSDKGRLEPYNYLIEDPALITSIVSNLEEVKFVTPRLQFSGLISTGENTISFIGLGIDPKYENAARLDTGNLRQIMEKMRIGGVVVTDGDALNETDSYSVMLGKGLASTIGVKAGDYLVLLANTTGGSVNALDVIVKGTFFTSSKAFDDHFLRLPLATAQKLLYTDSVQSLVVMLDKTEDTNKVKRVLNQIFKEGELNLELKSWDEVNEFYTQTVKLFNRLFFILKTVIAIIVILNIFNTMNMAVLERISEIGTIMALGTKRSGVIKLFLSEGITLGVIGGSLGVIFGTIITSAISLIGIPMPAPPGATMQWLSEPKIVFSMLLFAFILAVITSVISSLYPAYNASRLEIADALRHK